MTNEGIRTTPDGGRPDVGASAGWKALDVYYGFEARAWLPGFAVLVAREFTHYFSWLS